MQSKHGYFLITVKMMTGMLGKDPALVILQRLVFEQYCQYRHQMLSWPYCGWITPKPSNYDCPMEMWRRMPLTLQRGYIEHCDHLMDFDGGVIWNDGDGSSLEAFERMRQRNQEQPTYFTFVRQSSDFIAIDWIFSVEA